MNKSGLALDRRIWTGTAAQVALLLLVLNLGVAWQQKNLVREQQQNMLASAQNDSAIMANGPPRYDVSIGDRLAYFLTFVPDARANRLVYLVGMSQMYKINDQKPGDQTIAEHLDDRLKPAARVFGLAAPNLDNEEALFLLFTVLQDEKTKPHSFIYALCFDKMRFLGMRPQYLEYLRSRPALQEAMSAAAIKYNSRYPLAAEQMRSTIASLSAHQAEQDHSFEHTLRAGVASVSPLVAARKQLNAFFTFNILYQARNKLLGIKTTTKRPIIQGRYELNKQFLELMFDVAKDNDVQFITYINPLNPQAENPYVTSEYDTFKEWAAATAAKHSVPFANLENVVPQDAWGLLMGGPDFKHFGGEGHRRTAIAVDEHFRSVILGPAGVR